MKATRPDPFDRPADRLLLLLRATGPNAYRCCPQPGRWIARCPLCGEHRLDVFEHGFGRRASLRCAYGCDADEILRRLKHPERCHTCGAVHGQAAVLAHCADELLDLAHEQQHLLRALAAGEPDIAIAA